MSRRPAPPSEVLVCTIDITSPTARLEADNFALRVAKAMRERGVRHYIPIKKVDGQRVTVTVILAQVDEGTARPPAEAAALFSPAKRPPKIKTGRQRPLAGAFKPPGGRSGR